MMADDEQMFDEASNFNEEIDRKKAMKRDDFKMNRSAKSLLEWLDICVLEPEKRIGTSMKMQETYMVYLIETKLKGSSVPADKEDLEPLVTLWRRYSEFELLRNYMEITYPYVIVPPLPEKKWDYVSFANSGKNQMSFAWQNSSTDRFDPDYVERRRSGLETFLTKVAAHPILSADSILFGFLRQTDNWKTSVIATDFQSKAEYKIKAFTASYRIRKPDKRFEQVKNYSSDLQSHTADILRVRAKLADRLYGIHKIHANYGRVFSEWSAIEKEMGDGLQSAGHFMDVFASSIDTLLEDEDSIADQLKEYYAYADALKSVSRKQELLQLKLEQAEEALSNKGHQKEEIIHGAGLFTMTGMRSRLFGADPPDVKRQKLEKLEEEINDAELRLRQINEELMDFTNLALEEIEKFREQKVRDIQNTLTNYALMQVQYCKKSIQLWTNAKDCFDRM